MKHTHNLFLALALLVLAACEISKENPDAGAGGAAGRSAEDRAERAAERAAQEALESEKRRVAAREAFDATLAHYRKEEPLYDSGAGTIIWAERRDGNVFNGDKVVIMMDGGPEWLVLARCRKAQLENDHITLRNYPQIQHFDRDEWSVAKNKDSVLELHFDRRAIMTGTLGYEIGFRLATAPYTFSRSLTLTSPRRPGDGYIWLAFSFPSAVMA